MVGISQRRTAQGARFQCVAPLRWDPDEVIDLLAPELRTDSLRRALGRRAGALDPDGVVALGGTADPAEVAWWSVVEEFVSHLP